MQSIILLLLFFFTLISQQAKAEINVNKVTEKDKESVVITGLNSNSSYFIEFPNARPITTRTADQCGIVRIKYNFNISQDPGVLLSDGYQYRSRSINADMPRCVNGQLDANTRRLINDIQGIDYGGSEGHDGTWFVFHIKNTIVIWNDPSVWTDNYSFRRYGIQYLGSWGGDWDENLWSGGVFERRFKTNSCGQLVIRKKQKFIDTYLFDFPEYWITKEYNYRIKSNSSVVHTFSGNLSTKPKPICRKGTEYLPEGW